jgi:hypothetical protein
MTRIKTHLLAWAGFHRGKAISEKAMPRFHQIIDEMEREHGKIETLLSVMLHHAQDIRIAQVQALTDEEARAEADMSWAQFNAEHKELWHLLLGT